MPKNLSGIDIITDNAGTVITNGIVETNQITTNGNMYLSGSIINGVNNIDFNQQYEFIDIPKNLHIYGTGFIDYQGTTYNIGSLLAAFSGTGQISPYPSITYNSTTNETTYTGGQIFPSQSIDSTSINNSSFVTKTTSQSLTGIKTWSGTQIFNSIQLNSDLIVNNGGTTLSNSTLSKVQYLSGLTSDLNTRLNTDETNITTLQTKTNGLSYNVISQTSTFSNTLASSIFTFSTSINGATKLVFDNTMLYCNSLNANVQTALDALNLNVNGLKTKTTNINYSSPITTISNTLASTTFTFSTSINGATKSVFDNTMLYCNTLSGNVQTQINNAQSAADNAQTTADNAQNSANTAKDSASNAQSTANSAVAIAGTANGLAITAGGVATNALSSANLANSVNVTQQASIDQNITDITSLQVKTFSISRNSATNITSVSGTLSAATLRLDYLDSGINQLDNYDNSLQGKLEIHNNLYLLNYGNITCDGIINQTSTTAITGNSNQFTANTSMLGTLSVTGNQTNDGNFTTSGLQTSLNSSNIQIGTSNISTLTINSNTTCNGDFTMLTNKNLRLKNILPILLDDIIFGDNAGTYNDYNTIFNTQIIANRSLTLNADFQQGTNISRKTYLGFNDTYNTYASTSAALSAPSINLTATNTSITSTATLSVSSVTNNIISSGTTSITGLTTNIDGTFVNIGNVLSTNILYGSTYVQALYSPSGTINAIGTVMQQFV